MENDSWVDARIAALAVPPDWTPDAGRGMSRWRERRAAMRRSERRWTWTLSAAAAAAVLLLILPGGRAIAQRCAGACVAGASRAGAFLWRGLAPATLAPDFTLDDSDGRPVTLSAFRGQAVLLNFWATWCPPCKAEMPWFTEFQTRFASQGLVVLGVALDEDGWKAVRPLLAARPPGYRIMVGGEDVMRRYGGIDAVPATVLIDRAGRVAATHSGLVAKEVYEAELLRLLAAPQP